MTLLHLIPALSKKRIVLASGSPRRREILTNLGLTFEVVVSTFDEDLDKSQFGAGEYASETALHKCIEVATRLGADKPDLVIGSDTVVEIDGQILEKPADREDAMRMLRKLSGSEHRVHTGMALVCPGSTDPKLGTSPYIRQFHETTVVKFADISEACLQAYVDSGEPMDKAGSYGIQGNAGSFVSTISGCFYNVVGFPLHRFCSEVGELVEGGHLQIEAGGK
mmetsp:Transcript_34293/g.108654  ORF Transcript_34293/g.108654 Transcript_34293/m.108654 type:complete len:223 (+) Transcript_34293:3-671(+)